MAQKQKNEVSPENMPASGTGRKRHAQRWRPVDLLLQLAVVVAGILITFQGSAWIERNSERRQSREIVAMIKDELENNLKELAWSARVLRAELEGMDFFARHMYEIDKVPTDSIDIFLHVLGSGYEFRSSSNALEVLKASPLPVNAMDKELLRKIFTCYDRNDTLFDSVNYYYKQKFDRAGVFHFSLERKAIEEMQKLGNPYPYIKEYLDNTLTANLILSTPQDVGPKLTETERVMELVRETIVAAEDYIRGNKKRS